MSQVAEEFISYPNPLEWLKSTIAFIVIHNETNNTTSLKSRAIIFYYFF